MSLNKIIQHTNTDQLPATATPFDLNIQRIVGEKGEMGEKGEPGTSGKPFTYHEVINIKKSFYLCDGSCCFFASPKFILSSSENGQYQIFGTSVSTNYGKSWTIISQIIRSIDRVHSAISYTGQHQTIAIYHGFVFVSSNYGQSWTQTGQEDNWTSIAVSGSGLYQTATTNQGNGKIFTSSDYGVSWIIPDISMANWLDVAISGPGNFQIAINDQNAWSSLDYGATWTILYTFSASNLTSIKMSYSGQYILITTTNNVFTSNDFGASWNPIQNQPGSLIRPAISKNGQHQIIIHQGGTVLLTTNWGAEWILIEDISGNVIESIYISSDGSTVAYSVADTANNNSILHQVSHQTVHYEPYYDVPSNKLCVYNGKFWTFASIFSDQSVVFQPKFDVTNNKLMIYNGVKWVSVTLE